MVFQMPAGGEEPPVGASDLSPREIVAYLDRYIIGQDRAKRAVAIALRNRLRRQRLPDEIAEEVMPKNILMIGPTGVGKTEIARRLARMAGSPFTKVEASKFTEVGYVGRDVESMIRDLLEVAVEMARQEKRQQVRGKADRRVEERLLSAFVPSPPLGFAPSDAPPGAEAPPEPQSRLRESFRQQLRAGRLEEREIEIEVKAPSPVGGMHVLSNVGLEELGVNLKDMLPGLFGGGHPTRRKMPISEAREHLMREEEERLLDQETIAKDAIRRVEEGGIIFIDELDKVAGRERGVGPDVSREGVQRDLLPVIEGTIVHTKYGMVRTDHILFIAAGAFHISRPSDLIPELQGRFPIRVELDSLGRDEFVRILKEPRGSLIRQYTALIGTEGVELSFTDEAIEEIARFAALVNESTENIGARRLHTVMERLLDEISFEASEKQGTSVNVDGAMVRRSLADLAADQDLSRYVL